MNENIKIILICLITLVSALAVVIAVFGIIINIKTAAKRRKVEGFGRESEERIDALLKKAFGDNSVMTGIYLPYIKLDYEKHAEIDHVVILRGGIFVIEVKSHNGFIRNPNEHDWWQTYNDKKIRFYNPLRQNNTHVKILQDILKSEGYYNVPIHNVVVFTSNRVNFSHRYDNLLRSHELVGFIRRVGRKNIMSTSQTSRVRTLISSLAARDKNAAKKHKDAMRRYK